MLFSPSAAPLIVQIMVTEGFLSCLHSNPILSVGEDALVIGGEGNIYAADSSICISAIHAGVISRGGNLTVKLVPPTGEFEGSSRNGITSASRMNEAQKFRAFLVLAFIQKCPQDAVMTKAQSFLQTENLLVADARSADSSPVRLKNLK